MKYVKMALLMAYNIINCANGVCIGSLLGYSVLPLHSDPVWLSKLIIICFSLNVAISIILKTPKAIIGSVTNSLLIALLFIYAISISSFFAFLLNRKFNIYLLVYSLVFGGLFHLSLVLMKRFKRQCKTEKRSHNSSISRNVI